MTAIAQPHVESTSVPRRLLLGAVGVGWLLVTAAIYRGQLGDVFDDAYISFRYAANLAHGHGLVFNPGEYVEGYTNFLWTMMAAMAIWLGLDPALVATVLNVGLGLALLALVGWFGKQLMGWGRLADGWGWAAIFIVAASSPLAFALISGLESVLFTLLLTAAVFSVVLEQRGEAKQPLGGLLFALAALTRPEGALFWGITVLYQFILMFRRKSSIPSPLGGEGRVRGIGPLVAGFLVIWLPYMAWKVFYYGDIFPNTFYDKASNNTAQLSVGFNYVLSAWPYLFGPLAFALAVGVLLWRKRVGQTEGYFATLVLVNFVYVAYVGGDYLIGFRFLLPTFPLLALLLVAALAELVAVVPRTTRLPLLTISLIASVVGLSAMSAYDVNVLAQLQSEGSYNQGSKAVVDWLGQHAGADDVLAIETVGKIPYASGIRTIDMLGLTDAHIAHAAGRTDMFTPGHNKFDADYVLSRQPSYVMVYRIPSEGGYLFSAAFHPGSITIMSRPQFAANYTNVAVFPMWPGVEGWLYKRKAN